MNNSRPRILAVLAVAAALLPAAAQAAALLPAAAQAAAQAHWNNPCGCQRAALYRYHHAYYHHRYYAPRERDYAAVQLAPDVFAIPYRLRHYPYVSGGYGDGGIVSIGAPAVVEFRTQPSAASRALSTPTPRSPSLDRIA